MDDHPHVLWQEEDRGGYAWLQPLLRLCVVNLLYVAGSHGVREFPDTGPKNLLSLATSCAWQNVSGGTSSYPHLEQTQNT